MGAHLEGAEQDGEGRKRSKRVPIFDHLSTKYDIHMLKVKSYHYVPSDLTSTD